MYEAFLVFFGPLIMATIIGVWLLIEGEQGDG